MVREPCGIDLFMKTNAIFSLYQNYGRETSMYVYDLSIHSFTKKNYYYYFNINKLINITTLKCKLISTHPRGQSSAVVIIEGMMTQVAAPQQPLSGMRDRSCSGLCLQYEKKNNNNLSHRLHITYQELQLSYIIMVVNFYLFILYIIGSNQQVCIIIIIMNI